ncbi:hypothetical protein [Candidatus Nitrosotenuis sp. DW1]|uniref:hypothetical protein n=1 Tax=Candidatus Nitrosotenuis sp. DW1 TaxID=2259672 RepID=UPI0015C6FDDD|nr:hypothetical protein [Candidatus Nitrosotenuis sp. DW1]QLH08818.1 hypothetical protein DSQ19_04365 [Candidatus Nitrosotenuis sp. DW1]
MDFKKILGKVVDKLEDGTENLKESIEERKQRKREEEIIRIGEEALRRKRENDEREELLKFKNKVNDLLDKFEIPDFDKFLMKYLNNKPEPEYEKDEDSGRTRIIRPSRREYLDFIWEYLDDEEINYNQLKDFALKSKIVTPSFFGEGSDLEFEKTDFQIIVNSLKADFEPEAISDEEHLESQMMIFLKAKFPDRKIRRQITIQGNDRLDILVDDKYAFELKVPKARSDLRNLGAQLAEYKEKYPNICSVIYNIDEWNLSQDIIDYVDKYKRDYGVLTVVLDGRKRG